MLSISKLKNLPDQPGIYYFKNKQNRVIYVGKAASLKKRVFSYFRQNRNKTFLAAPLKGVPPFGLAGARLIENMLNEVSMVDFETCKNVLEALVKESATIKKLNPIYNIVGRDDRSMAYLILTKEKYPKFKIVRAREFERGNIPFWKSFGQFFSARSIILSLGILRKIFPYSDCNPPKTRLKTGARVYSKPCFYYGMGQCPGVCVGVLTSNQYKKLLKPLILFFSGELTGLRKRMDFEMRQSAHNRDFEKAAKLRDQIFMLEHMQDIALLGQVDEEERAKKFALEEMDLEKADNILQGRIEGYDISHMGGKGTVAAMIVFEGGAPKKLEYRKFNIKTAANNDVQAIKETLARRLKHIEWDFPDFVLIDGGKAQVNAARKIFENSGIRRIKIAGIAKGPLRKRNDIVYDRRDIKLGDEIRRNLSLLVRVRDEAHRFAKAFQKKKRLKLSK